MVVRYAIDISPPSLMYIMAPPLLKCMYRMIKLLEPGTRTRYFFTSPDLPSTFRVSVFQNRTMSSDSSKADISKPISEQKTLKNNTSMDEARRQELAATLTEASLAVESPLETVNRIAFSISLS